MNASRDILEPGGFFTRTPARTQLHLSFVLAFLLVFHFNPSTRLFVIFYSYEWEMRRTANGSVSQPRRYPQLKQATLERLARTNTKKLNQRKKARTNERVHKWPATPSPPEDPLTRRCLPGKRPGEQRPRLVGSPRAPRAPRPRCRACGAWSPASRRTRACPGRRAGRSEPLARSCGCGWTVVDGSEGERTEPNEIRRGEARE